MPSACGSLNSSLSRPNPSSAYILLDLGIGMKEFDERAPGLLPLQRSEFFFFTWYSIWYLVRGEWHVLITVTGPAPDCRNATHGSSSLWASGEQESKTWSSGHLSTPSCPALYQHCETAILIPGPHTLRRAPPGSFLLSLSRRARSRGEGRGGE